MARQLERFPNLVAMFFTRAAERGDAPFLWSKQAGAWQSISWADAARQVASLATALKAIGLKRGDRVMLVSENRPEWCISDLAIMAAGCVTVPTYVTNTVRDHGHIIENSGACAIIVSTEKLARTVLPAALRTTQSSEKIIMIERMKTAQQGSLEFHDWHDLIARHPADPASVAAQADFTRDDLACIIYTSGTGGSPRGVMQHHGAILHNVNGCCTVISEDFGWDDEVFLSFLPLSHAYEHTGGQHFPIALGGQIYYSEGLDKLASNIEEVRPTIMVVVPRLFEVLRTRITKAVQKQGRVSSWLLDRAVTIGGKENGPTLLDRPTKLLVDTLLKPKVGKRFGGRLKAMVSGGAPLNPEVGGFFQSLGLCFLQGYGQTEAAPVISCNRPAAGIKMDTVGPPLAETEVRIAEDGEILVRGELVMHGYWRNEAETARVLKDGWLHTGDIGEIDAKGRIRITDRKKDIIVNDKGDNVAPQKVEGMLTLQNEIAQAMIAGDRRPYMVAVIVPDAEWTQQFCAKGGARCDFAKLREDSDYRAALGAAVERVNKDLSVTERIRRFIIADEPFTIENQQLTPSLKIRRHVLKEVYGERLDALYRN
ncbi:MULTISPECIES: AMP-dependent synthetase/ligase [Sphingomonas]|jgi:long-chain acyl-CoA synthetase|uniref:AMP-dependent synthetase n=1 Tax=Sphingomonas hankookensis TaxID=563996 RepID=A0ABR5Y901_9SPHN|nr:MULTISPECIES: AMP-dependent synthetase/ligase [Sphingomonas]KZE11014.1 AMP-dependent synthetase [Sphingomonas hankookensis]PZT91854.1 MAG: long-chain fatty acid--CoA ligase [Sphingomonas sp.]RSV31590.1 long-chain fatty acid--CoA ligase [Sphingomonas sp. ABOLH]WCP71686.1 AMP-dependent synthetase/ligase [Sphingomonas hankookensis]